ncbi:arylsulfatase [Parapedobacter soli]|uniref:arylsulfatase n=1 Tax=Parapedobacter soli TaxID=416955 RepID=UPI0021C6A5D7|nr:arylsulfatase [Parapedobacter soli]
MWNRQVVYVGTALVLAIIIAVTFYHSSCGSKDKANRPNIILILADDMGFSDLGSYGATRIRTPVLDSLAYHGLRFTQFYNGAKCCPTRASLITGLYPHQTGVGGMVAAHDIPPPVPNGPYQGYLNRNCVTIAEVLRETGYSTLMAGKWHVGENRPHWPTDRGFDKYFGLISGAANYFDITKTVWKGVKRKMAFNDSLYTPPKEGFYMTDAITDYAIRFLEEETGKRNPFFLYLSYTAPHSPLQALESDINKYEGQFDIGWDRLKRERLGRMQELGLFEGHDLFSVLERDAALLWDNVENKRDMASKMEVYAAQIDRMDQGIGRILTQLNKMGKDKNTLILFLSDNGASPAGGYSGFDFGQNGYQCGHEDSYMSYGQGWANLSNTPFRSYKGHMYDGGICTPFIAYWPSEIKAAQITQQPGYVVDIMKTLCDVGRATYPSEFADNPITPTPGRSLLPIFRGEELKEPEFMFWEHGGNRGLRHGNLKLVGDFESPWELYDLSKDRFETHDLAISNHDQVSRLDTIYESWARKVGVYLYPNRDFIYRGQSKAR